MDSPGLPEEVKQLGATPWLVGICSVVFDVDFGQKVECMVPSGVLSEAEQVAVGFHSFPDSMSMELQLRSSIRDSSFFFRIRRQTSPPTDAELLAPAPSYLYGFVFCRQRQDPTLRRGGEQSSVVVLSQQPFSSVLRPLSQIAGPLYYNSGAAALEQVYTEVLQWPPPIPGPLLQLPVGMVSISARIPPPSALPHQPFENATMPMARHSSLSRSSSLNVTAASAGSLSALDRTSLALAAAASPGTSSALSTGTAPAPIEGEASPAPPRSRRGTLEELQLPASPPDEPRYLSDDAASSSQPSVANMRNQQGASTSGSPGRSLSSASRHASLLRRAGTLDAEPTGGLFSEVDVWSPFHTLLPKVWSCWELVLLGLPLMVVAQSPGEACGAVAALVSLVAPLPYAADFRPYYTIQDTAFKLLAAGQLPGSCAPGLPALIGVTNLFFVKALAHWPNVLAVGHPTANGINGSAAFAAAGNAVRALRRRGQGPSQLMTEHCQALWATYRPLIKQDAALLARMAQPKGNDPKARSRAALINSEALHKHFQELTTAFLAPFNRYFESGDSGTVPPFEPLAFLEFVRSNKPAPVLHERLGSTPGARVELYRRFLASPNFQPWFDRRRAPVQHLVDKQAVPPEQPSAFSPAFAQAMSHMDEVQCVEAFFGLEQELKDALLEAGSQEASPDIWDRLARIKAELVAVLGRMPEDLQQTMASAPSRREMLQSLHAEHGSPVYALLAGLHLQPAQ